MEESGFFSMNLSHAALTRVVATQGENEGRVSSEARSGGGQVALEDQTTPLTALICLIIYEKSESFTNTFSLDL